MGDLYLLKKSDRLKKRKKSKVFWQKFGEKMTKFDSKLNINSNECCYTFSLIIMSSNMQG